MLLDPQAEEYDKHLSDHLVSLYVDGEGEEEEIEHLDMSLLKDYIGYARANFHPALNSEAQECLKQAYVEMRKAGSGRGQITAYPRQLESLVRLAEAHAKMRFKNIVEVSDVEEAKRLHREAIKQSAIDPNSGKIDISILTTGFSSTHRRIQDQISIGLKQLIEHMKNDKIASASSGQAGGDAVPQDFVNLSYQTVFNDFRADNPTVSKESFEEALKQLLDDNFLQLIGQKTIRIPL